MAKTDRERRGGVLEKTRDKTARPKLYKVVLHNDDYTPMDFVIDVLESIFDKSPAESYRVMMHVHTQGVGIAGVYSHEVAETKVAEVHTEARMFDHPLHASMEPE